VNHTFETAVFSSLVEQIHKTNHSLPSYNLIYQNEPLSISAGGKCFDGKWRLQRNRNAAAQNGSGMHISISNTKDDDTPGNF